MKEAAKEQEKNMTTLPGYKKGIYLGTWSLVNTSLPCLGPYGNTSRT